MKLNNLSKAERLHQSLSSLNESIEQLEKIESPSSMHVLLDDDNGVTIDANGNAKRMQLLSKCRDLMMKALLRERELLEKEILSL